MPLECANQCHSIKSFFKAYKQMSTIGEGGVAMVFRGENVESGLTVAIKKSKKVKKGKKSQKACRPRLITVDGMEVPSEFIYQKKAGRNNSGVAEIYDWFRKGNEVILVMEHHHEWVDLYKLIYRLHHPLDEEKVKFIFLQILNAVEGCHKNGVAHLDIKLENIVMNQLDCRIKLIDFGHSRPLEDGISIDNGGTPLTYPPEHLDGELHHNVTQFDYWGLGIVLFELCNTAALFRSESDILNCEEIVNDSFTDSCTSDARDLIRGMLRCDMEERLNGDSIIEHRWFTESNNSDIICTEVTRFRDLHRT